MRRANSESQSRYQAADPLIRVCHPCNSYKVKVFETGLLVTNNSNVITRACRYLDGKRLDDGLRMKPVLQNSSYYLTKTPPPHHMQLFLLRKETDELSPKAIGCEYFYWNLSLFYFHQSRYFEVLQCFAMFSFSPNRELSALNMYLEPRRKAIKGKLLKERILTWM